MNLSNDFNAVLSTTSSSNSFKNIDHYVSIIEKYVSYTSNPILDTICYHNNSEIDERMLGKILPKLTKIPKIVIKTNPQIDYLNRRFGQLDKYGVDAQLYISLQNLGIEYAEAFFLNYPDLETPLEETLEICDELWRKEKFNHLGISNFSHSKLVEILTICDIRGYNAPMYYQGIYNLICRKVEVLFPILDDNCIEFWAHNPLADELLTGKYKCKYNPIPVNSNCFQNNQICQNIFWKEIL